MKRMDRMSDLCSVRNGVNAIENVLRWYGHVRKMNENRLEKKIFESNCSGRKRVERTRRRRM